MFSGQVAFGYESLAKIRLVFLLVASFFYASLIVLFPTGVGGSIVTLGFIFACLGYFGFELKLSSVNQQGFSQIGAALGCMFLGIAAGAYISHAPEGTVWISDAVFTHVPMAERMAAALKQGTFWAELRGLAPGTTTHFLNAMSFMLFGRSIYSSLLTLFVLKFAAAAGIYLLASKMFDRRAGYFAALVYILVPTVLFYTLTLYKEAAVHAYTAWICYFIFLFGKEKKLWALVPAFVLMGMLSFERIYLPWIFLISYLSLLLSYKGPLRIVAIAVVCVSFIFVYSFTPWLKMNPLLILDKLKELRQAQMVYTDYSFTLNYEIPYVLAVIKTFFTPYFTLSKFQLFRDFSYLLIWGSFVNQLVVLAFLYQWFKEVKKQRVLHISFFAPFLIFILLLAYVAPWAGRIRDSFYPIIAVYAGCFIAHWSLGVSWLNSKPALEKEDTANVAPSSPLRKYP